MKKPLALLLSLALLLTLAACGGKTPAPEKDETTVPAEPADVPAGVWVIRYLGNENGEFVEEFNMVEDFYGNPIELLELSTLEFGEASYFRLNEEGEGTWTDFSKEPVEIRLDGENIYLPEDVVKPYRREGDRLWFESEPGFYTVMENVSEDYLQKVLRGAWDTVELENAQVGDLVALGTYDTAPGNDKTEALKWRVIDKDGDRLLLLCDKLIDSFAYDNQSKDASLNDVTWEKSSLRAFLNGDFLTADFTEDEIALIETTHLVNKAENDLLNEIWAGLEDKGEATYSELHRQDVADAPDTDDRVFLLSVADVMKYFGDETAVDEDQSEENYPFSHLTIYPKAIAKITKAVQDNGDGYYDRETFGGAWMTRAVSRGSHGNPCVVYVSGSGHIFNYFTYASMFIRPAMWVKVPQA